MGLNPIQVIRSFWDRVEVFSSNSCKGVHQTKCIIFRVRPIQRRPTKLRKGEGRIGIDRAVSRKQLRIPDSSHPPLTLLRLLPRPLPTTYLRDRESIRNNRRNCFWPCNTCRWVLDGQSYASTRYTLEHTPR